MGLLELDIHLDPLWKQVADGIRWAIQTGRLRPGDRIIESQIAAQLGISRGPIREGIRQLQERGILQYRTNAGTEVVQVSRADALQVVRTRIFLETSAVELALKSDASELEDNLKWILKRMQETAGDAPLEHVEALDEEFHTALIRAAGSNVLLHQWQMVDPYTWMAIARQTFGVGEIRRPVRIYDDHQPLLDVLKSGDVIAAQAAIRHHIAYAASLPDEDGL